MNKNNDEIKFNNLIENMTRDVKNLNDDFSNWFRYVAPKRMDIFNKCNKEYEWGKTILANNHKKLKFKINYYKIIKCEWMKTEFEIYYKNQFIGFLKYYLNFDSPQRFKYDVRLGFTTEYLNIDKYDVFALITNYILTKF